MRAFKALVRSKYHITQTKKNSRNFCLAVLPLGVTAVATEFTRPLCCLKGESACKIIDEQAKGRILYAKNWFPMENVRIAWFQNRAISQFNN